MHQKYPAISLANIDCYQLYLQDFTADMLTSNTNCQHLYYIVSTSHIQLPGTFGRQSLRDNACDAFWWHDNVTDFSRRQVQFNAIRHIAFLSGGRCDQWSGRQLSQRVTKVRSLDQDMLALPQAVCLISHPHAANATHLHDNAL